MLNIHTQNVKMVTFNILHVIMPSLLVHNAGLPQ